MVHLVHPPSVQDEGARIGIEEEALRVTNCSQSRSVVMRLMKMGRSITSTVTSTPIWASCVLMMVAMVGAEGSAVWHMMVYFRGFFSSNPASLSKAFAFSGL